MLHPFPKQLEASYIKIIYYTVTIITKMEEMENTKCWQGFGTSGTLCTVRRESKLLQPPWKTDYLLS